MTHSVLSISHFLVLFKAQLEEPVLGISIFFCDFSLFHFSLPCLKRPALKTPKPALKQPNQHLKNKEKCSKRRSKALKGPNRNSTETLGELCLKNTHAF